MLRQALILAGGLGSRLGDRVARSPKPLLEVAGKPFVVHVIENLRRFEIDRFVFSVGYLGDHFAETLGNGSGMGVAIDYVVEEEPMGTGGALRLCRDRLDEVCLVVNGDTLFDLNFLALANILTDGLTEAAMGLRHVAETTRYGKVIEHQGRIARLSSGGHAGPGWISGGVYALRADVLDRLPLGKSSVEADLFPQLAQEGLLRGLHGTGFFLDIGVPEDFERATAEIEAWRHRPAVFFDRDGTLNEDPGYVHRPEDLVWKREAREAVRWANDHGYLAIVVTNQAGIAKRKFSESDFANFMAQMRRDLAEEGAHLDAVYHCPFHPDGQPPYQQDSPDRKPRPGMFLRAVSEWNVDISRSLAIGDRATDLEAAEAAGIKGVLYEGGSLLERLEQAARDL